MREILNIVYRVQNALSRKRQLEGALVLLLMVFSSVLEVASIGSLLPFVKVISSPQTLLESNYFGIVFDLLNIDTRVGVVILTTSAFCSIVLISSITRSLLIVCQTKFANSVGVDLSVLAFNGFLTQDYETQISQGSEELLSMVGKKIDFLAFHLIAPFLMLVSSLVIIASFSIFLFFIAPGQIFMLLAFLGIFYYLIVRFFRQNLVGLSNSTNQLQTEVFEILKDSSGLVRELIIGSHHKFYVEIFKKTETKLRNGYARITIIGALPKIVIEAFALILVSLFVMVVFITSNAGELSIVDYLPILAAIALSMQRLIPLCQQVYLCLVTMNGVKAQSLLGLEFIEKSLNVNQEKQSTSKIKFLNKIEFNQVSFCYSSGSKTTLHDLSFRIRRGDMVGITGKTGSGKSTLMDLMMGLLYPTKGQILIDGKVLSKENLLSWQNNIAHVSQQVFLTNLSIRENIALGIPSDKICDLRVNAAVKVAELSGFLNSLPNGLETPIGDNGIKLSGGQRQRLSVARGLYEQKPILILDEATSALDQETEHKLIENIINLPNRPTLFMISHRQSVLNTCDYLINPSGIVSAVSNKSKKS